MADIEVKYNGNTYRFPEGTSEEVMRAAMMKVAGKTGESVTSKVTYDTNPLTTREPLAPGQVPFNMGSGLPPVNVTPGPRTRGAVIGAASGLPNPIAMGIGGAVGAALPPEAPATEIGQGLGQSAAMAALNRLVPGAGYAGRALTSAAGVLGGGAVGTQVDKALGNETQSGETQGVAALLSGLLVGRGPKALPSQTGDAALSPFVQGASKPGGSEALARAVNSKLFRGFLKGNKQFAQDTFTAVDQYLDETFEPLGQTEILDILGKTRAAASNPEGAAFSSTIKSLVKSQDPTRSSETILRTYFGKEPTQALAAATFLQDSLPPEDYKKISNAWLTRVFFKDALTEASGLDGKGSKMVQDIAESAPGRGKIPYVLLGDGASTALPYSAARGGPDFALSGEKLRFAKEKYGKEALERMVGPEAYSVIDDVSTVMDLLSLDKPNESWRNRISQAASGTLRYQGNRFVYIASGIGSGLGAGALAGVLPMAALTAGGIGLGFGVDSMIQKGVQNPALMTALRKAVEASDGRATSTALRALMASQATQPQGPPDSR